MNKELKAEQDNAKRLMNAVWDILLKHGEVSEEGREMFMSSYDTVRQQKTLEYRFCGSLAFDGKVWINNGPHPYVNCYQENETRDRKERMKSINEDLKALAC